MDGSREEIDPKNKASEHKYTKIFILFYLVPSNKTKPTEKHTEKDRERERGRGRSGWVEVRGGNERKGEGKDWRKNWKWLERRGAEEE